MKKRKSSLILLVSLAVILVASAVVLVITQYGGTSESSKTEKKAKLGSFGEFTDCEVFQDVPAMLVEGTTIGKATDYGDENYIIDVNGTSVEDYKNYLTTLEKEGFVKHSDNGEEAMEGYVYTASYTKENLTLTVAQLVRMNKTYISGSFDLPLSEHLNYKDEYMANAPADAKTKVHMLELHSNGNSFLIQLKNGHFVLHDGGNVEDAPYLLDYMESLVPEGEKPVIEAWFITHPHSDHHGALKEIISDDKMVDRIYVEGLYYVEMSKSLYSFFTSEKSLAQAVFYIKSAASILKAQSGENTTFYRPQIGQKYYFGDMTIDVALTLEQFTEDTWHTADLNDTSIWLMHNIEGQRMLLAGDAGIGATKLAMLLYDEDYFDVDVFAVLHHGINVYNYFTDYCTIDTLLYTNFRVGSLYENGSKYAMEEQNKYLQSTVLESLSHGGGTVVLTFPYKVGTSEKMPACDWRYHGGKPIRMIFK